jgi:hypothetical protein
LRLREATRPNANSQAPPSATSPAAPAETAARRAASAAARSWPTTAISMLRSAVSLSAAPRPAVSIAAGFVSYAAKRRRHSSCRAPREEQLRMPASRSRAMRIAARRSRVPAPGTASSYTSASPSTPIAFRARALERAAVIRVDSLDACAHTLRGVPIREAARHYRHSLKARYHLLQPV